MKKIIFSLLFLIAPNCDLPAQTSFFEGKTARILVGFSPGGAYDVWSRLIAHHMSKHIPGNPTFVVQNMTGGGSMIAANYVFNVAKPDGLTIAVVTPALYIEQLAGRKEVHFDWPKFSWVGSPERTERIFSTVFVRALGLRLRATAPMRKASDKKN